MSGVIQSANVGDTLMTLGSFTSGTASGWEVRLLRIGDGELTYRMVYGDHQTARAVWDAVYQALAFQGFELVDNG